MHVEFATSVVTTIANAAKAPEYFLNQFFTLPTSLPDILLAYSLYHIHARK